MLDKFRAKKDFRLKIAGIFHGSRARAVHRHHNKDFLFLIRAPWLFGPRVLN